MHKRSYDLETDAGAPYLIAEGTGLQLSNVKPLYYPRVSAVFQPRGAGAPIEGKALIDTGADATGVAEHLARQFGWSPIMKGIPLHTAGNSIPSNVHEVTLAIGDFEPFPLRVMTVILLGRRHIALLGTDVLARGRFTYDGLAKKFTLELP